MSTKLIDLVEFLFSKNAGPYIVTFDVVFKDDETYRRVCESGVFTKPRIAALFRVAEDRIHSIHQYDAGRVIKFNLIRDISSGDFGDRTVFGSQLWAPLIDLEIPGPQSGYGGYVRRTGVSPSGIRPAHLYKRRGPRNAPGPFLSFMYERGRKPS